MCYSNGPRCAESLNEEMRKVNKEFAHAKTNDERMRLGTKLSTLQAEYDGTPERVRMLRDDALQTQSKHEKAKKLGYVSICEQGYQNRIVQSMLHVAKMRKVSAEDLVPFLPDSHRPSYGLQNPILNGADLIYDSKTLQRKPVSR